MGHKLWATVTKNLDFTNVFKLLGAIGSLALKSFYVHEYSLFVSATGLAGKLTASKLLGKDEVGGIASGRGWGTASGTGP